MNKVREIIFYKHYFETFFNAQTGIVKNKIDQVLFLITHVLQVPEKFLKHIEGTKGLNEIRIESGNNIFCCFDK